MQPQNRRLLVLLTNLKFPEVCVANLILFLRLHTVSKLRNLTALWSFTNILAFLCFKFHCEYSKNSNESESLITGSRPDVAKTAVPPFILYYM